MYPLFRFICKQAGAGGADANETGKAAKAMVEEAVAAFLAAAQAVEDNMLLAQNELYAGASSPPLKCLLLLGASPPPPPWCAKQLPTHSLAALSA